MFFSRHHAEPKSSMRAFLFAGLALLSPLNPYAAQGGAFLLFPSGGISTNQNVVVDFSASSSSFTWPTISSAKYLSFVLNGAKGCVDVQTSNIPNTAAGDTRIYYRKNVSPAPSWAKLDNDSGPDKYSEARIWIDDSKSASIEIALAAGSTTYNSMSFYYKVSSLTATSKSACENTAYPLLTEISGTYATSRAN